MMPDNDNGTYRVSQVIDHDSPGHFRYSSFAPDGRLLTSIAQDPGRRQRVSLIRVDDQRYRFEFAMPAGDVPSLPEIERLHMQATVAMMQASGQQVLQTVDGADGPLYRIEVPEVSAAQTGAMWDLSRAEVLIDAKDFRIMEFSARGTFLEQPYSMSYRLITRSIVGSVKPEVFAVPSEPGEIVITGDGTASPATDVVFAALRELARAKGRSVIASAIRADGLTKYYGPVVAIEDLSFEVERGEIYGFLGANGAGKTTTIRLLLDLVRPARGTAAILGVDCHRSSLAARKLVGYLPGELPIYPDLSAAGYLDYLRALDGRPVADGHLRHLLKRFDVSAVDLQRRLRDQSHGMKRKIGIVQALMGRAPVIILDEPTAGLDPLMIQAFGETLADLKRQGDTTVFLSSHVLAEVESTCDRIGVVRGWTHGDGRNRRGAEAQDAKARED